LTVADQWPPGDGGFPPDKGGGMSRSGLRRALRIAAAATVAVVMVAAARDLSRGSSRPTIGQGPDLTPSPTAPSQSRDPSAPLLADLVVNDADVGPSLTVAGLSGGNGLTEPTLDLCNGTFPSESQRTARLQVAAVDQQQGDTVLSTEAVLYSSGAGTAAAFNELKATPAACPPDTRFGPAPDADWPQVATVERLAFAFDSVEANGDTTHRVVVYLRRGRALLGVYFFHADAPTAVVQGKTALGDVVTIFANRLAKLPVSAISTTA
jgi:hypothetical protein